MKPSAFTHAVYAEYVRSKAEQFGHELARATADYRELHPEAAPMLDEYVRTQPDAYKLLRGEIEAICQQRKSAIGRTFLSSADNTPSPATVVGSFVARDGRIMDAPVINGGTRTSSKY